MGNVLQSLTNCSVERGACATALFTLRVPFTLHVPSVPKYGGNSDTEPFKDQFELVTSVTN